MKFQELEISARPHPAGNNINFDIRAIKVDTE
jgi:hypothetical protein